MELFKKESIKFKHAAVLIAAPWSGSGKTTISCALMQALVDRGRTVRAFKCGPDYIDPMFHRTVIGVPSRNLDTFFSDEKQIQELFDLNDGQISVIEGVMGLYDGLGGTEKEGSAYHLAQTLDIPIVLVLDAHGMGRTMIPLLKGILQYDTDGRIAGVILNRTSRAYYEKIRPLIEEELALPVLGCFPKIPDIKLESRHLGLKMPEEIEDLKSQLARAAELMESGVDIDRIEEIAGITSQNPSLQTFSDDCRGMYEKDTGQKNKMKVRIGIAVDEVFCFYYEDNLRLLREAGAELVPFSPLHDHQLPENIHGLLLGGGYPELRMSELSDNILMRRAIHDVIVGGMPSVAECGGFLYLHDYMEGADGKRFPMAGIIRGGTRNTGKLVRFGYITIEEKTPSFLAEGARIKAHEFHYFDSDSNGSSCRAAKPTTNRSWECVHGGTDHWWGFPHLYYPSNPDFVYHFVQKCEEKYYKAAKNA